MSGMADALSSASLLLAALALVYGAWSSAIDAELARKYSANEATRATEKEGTRKIMNGRALPLMAGSWLIVAVFTPRLLCILFEAFQCVRKGGCGYDDVAMIFVLTYVFVFGLAIHLSGLWKKLKVQSRPG